MNYAAAKTVILKRIEEQKWKAARNIINDVQHHVTNNIWNIELTYLSAIIAFRTEEYCECYQHAEQVACDLRLIFDQLTQEQLMSCLMATAMAMVARMRYNSLENVGLCELYKPHFYKEIEELKRSGRLTPDTDTSELDALIAELNA